MQHASMTAKDEYLSRCENDFKFFARNEVYIRPKKKTKDALVPLIVNPGQTLVVDRVDELERQGKPVRILVLKARQWGCTTLVQSMVMHRSRFRPYHDAIIIADREKTTRSIMGMNRRMFDSFSPAVLDGWDRKSSVTDRFYEWNNGSILDIDTAGASQAARSTTRDMVHGSECAFWPNGDKIITALMPTVPDTPESCMVFESTSNGPHGIFWELWESAESEWSEWERIFVPWHIHPEYEDELPPELLDLSVRAAAGEKSALDQLHWLDERDQKMILDGELTLSKAHWKRKTVQTRFRGKEEDFQREFPTTPEDAWAAARYGYMSAEGKKIQDEAEESFVEHDVFLNEKDGMYLGPRPLVLVEPDYRPWPVEDEGGCVHVIDEPYEEQTYVIGVDPAEGTENDYSSFAVRSEGEIVCTFYRNDIPTDVFAEYLYCVGTWYNDAMMVIERKGGGLAVINTLLRLGYPSLMSKETFDEFGEAKGKAIGFNPDQENLRSLLAMFRHTINTGALLLRHPRLIQEAGWIIRRTKIGADEQVQEKWICPSKGVVTPHGIRLSDDMFRAAALTELVARDGEWGDDAEEMPFTTEWKRVPLAKTDYRTDSENVYFEHPDNPIPFPTPMATDDWEFDEDMLEDEDEQYG